MYDCCKACCALIPLGHWREDVLKDRQDLADRFGFEFAQLQRVPKSRTSCQAVGPYICRTNDEFAKWCAPVLS